jgi:hypothetical protein
MEPRECCGTPHDAVERAGFRYRLPHQLVH